MCHTLYVSERSGFIYVQSFHSLLYMYQLFLDHEELNSMSVLYHA